VLSRFGTVVLVYSFTLDQLFDNDLSEIHADDLNRLELMYHVTRHA
jgi:hypothetical protein